LSGVPPQEGDGDHESSGVTPEEVGEPVDVVTEASLTISEVGAPDILVREAVRRAWWQELIRSYLALLFTLLLFATIGYACWAATTDHWTNAKELLDIALPAETALLGSATGFYFGSRRD
jgi:hypothetical protein